MGAAGRQAAFAFDGEDLDLVAAGHLERQRLAGGGRHAVARRAGVELEEERLAGHLGVAGQALVAAQGHQVFREDAALLRHEVALVAGLLVLGAHGLVEDGQRGIDQGLVWPPARTKRSPKRFSGWRMSQRMAPLSSVVTKHVHLGARAAGVAALAQVRAQGQSAGQSGPWSSPIARSEMLPAGAWFQPCWTSVPYLLGC